MSYRYMRVIVFFDLPVETAVDRRNYSKFRKFLINEGFIMMQESVYTKLTLNNSVTESVRQKLLKNKPPKGIVEMLVITEKQFASIEIVVGSENKNQIDSTDRLLIL